MPTMSFDPKVEVQNHYDEVVKKHGRSNVFFTALYGSHNYHLNDAFSDVDSKSFIFPSLENLIQKVGAKDLFELKSGQAQLIDLRQGFDQLWKENISILELLFTDYYVVSERYKDYWELLRSKREEIAAADQQKLARNIYYSALDKYNKLHHITDANRETIEKFGYDTKQLHHILRLGDFMDSYFVKGKSFAESLISPMPDFNIKVKRGYYVCKFKNTEACAPIELDHMNQIIHSSYIDRTVHTEVREEFTDFIYDMFGERFYSL